MGFACIAGAAGFSCIAGVVGSCCINGFSNSNIETLPMPTAKVIAVIEIAIPIPALSMEVMYGKNFLGHIRVLVLKLILFDYCTSDRSSANRPDISLNHGIENKINCNPY